MITISEKISTRIINGLKRFQPIILNNKSKDVNESDTVVLVIDILSEIFGFDKYNDITTEHAVRGTFCDIALNVDGKLSLLLEVKAIGIDLKTSHVTQAVNYGANEGVKWVILTNARIWKIFKVTLAKSIQTTLVCEIDMLELKSKNKEDVEKLFILTKEAIAKSSLDHFFNKKQATTRYMIGNLILVEPIINAIKKELHLIFPDIKVKPEEISNVLLNEVLKREILEGEESEIAQKKISKIYKKKEKFDKPDDIVADSEESKSKTVEENVTSETQSIQ